MLCLTTSETKMLRSDLMQVFKILHNSDRVTSFFSFAAHRRGHSFKLYKSRFNVDIVKFAFSKRVCDSWNLFARGFCNCLITEYFKEQT